MWSSSQRTYTPFKQVSGKLTYESEELLINRRDRVRTISVKAEAGVEETTGEAFATILTMNAVPVLYSIFYKIEVKKD